MMPARQLPILHRALANMKMGKILTPYERDAMQQLLDKMMGFQFGDDITFNRARLHTQKYKYQTEENVSEEEVIIYDGDKDEQEAKRDKKVKKKASKDTNGPGQSNAEEEDMKEEHARGANRPADKHEGDTESPKQGSSVVPPVTDGPKQTGKPGAEEPKGKDKRPSIGEGLISDLDSEGRRSRMSRRFKRAGKKSKESLLKGMSKSLRKQKLKSESVITQELKSFNDAYKDHLNKSLEDKGVHIVTVNDYLAKRDSEWMGEIYKFLGLSVGCITAGIEDNERKNAYKCDITYGTNNEFGFDYLRDNMKYSKDTLVQKKHNFGIVDEVDNILIDEARTPLIISGPTQDTSSLYSEINKLIPQLKDVDFEKDEKSKSVNLTDKGVETIEKILKEKKLLKNNNLFDSENIVILHHINQALRAHKLFEKDTDYIVKNNQVIIIDEFTGRMMEGRRFSEGLHQALEAKESVKIQNENQTLASTSFQNYFRLYPKLAGMTGTAMTEAPELLDIYNLQVIEIPTNKICIRVDQDDEIYRTKQEKYSAIVSQIAKCKKKKQRHLESITTLVKD